MARSKRQSKPRARRTPAERSRRFEGKKLQAPNLDWNSPPEQFRFPETRDLKGMEPGQLSDLLKRFNITEPWPQMRVSTAGYVQRMSSIPPGSDAFKDEIERLLDSSSKRGARSQLRRAYREYLTIEMLDGDPNTELIWISDGGDGMCDRCPKRGGEIGTIQEHAAKGLPGAAVCAGGDDCRCTLAAIG